MCPCCRGGPAKGAGALAAIEEEEEDEDVLNSLLAALATETGVENIDELLDSVKDEGEYI